MASTTSSAVFQSLDGEAATCNGKVDMVGVTPYWWNTSGRDLSNMLHEANYPEEVQRQFLSYYRDNICPLLGARPDNSSAKSGVGWDGNPLEYSFELRGSTKKKSVRFVVDLSELRPADKNNTLSMATTQKVVDALAEKTPGFDDTWYRVLKEWFVYSHLSPSEQETLIAKAGQQTSVILGFDIYPHVTKTDRLPVMGKVYFPPCYVAADKGMTRWQAVRSALQQLPSIESFPNILKSANMINDFLSDKPEAWQMGTRYLATDLVAPSKARFKVYMRCFGTTFDEIWDYYTLGGRIPDLDDDKEKFRDLMDFVSGTTYAETRSKNQMELLRFTSASQKLTAIYFSLSADNPYPAPKLCVYPANFAPNDEVIARGLDKWLSKYGWFDGGKSMEEQVKTVFTHRKLEQKTGIFTFIGIGRKDDPTKKDLSIQVYLTPELYETPRY
ncbi:aromatic prenyltransferase [Leptodontidium sp. 2 PMI_412]|nr:aromatic prenyltransferase [Leptodontidium sp. 2 PMI_412]